jgi:hypothetical protein
MRIRDCRVGLACLVLCSCLHLDAEPVGGNGSSSSARSMFDSEVYPILFVECSDCHSTDTPGTPYGFVTSDVSTAYAAVMGYQGLMGDFTPTGTPLLTDDDEFHPSQFNASELRVLEDWLAAERTERNL